MFEYYHLYILASSALLGAGGVKKRVWLWKPRPLVPPVNRPLVGGLAPPPLIGRLGRAKPAGRLTSLNSAAKKSSTCMEGGRLVFCFLCLKMSCGRLSWLKAPRPRPRGATMMWARLAGSTYSDLPLPKETHRIILSNDWMVSIFLCSHMQSSVCLIWTLVCSSTWYAFRIQVRHSTHMKLSQKTRAVALQKYLEVMKVSCLCFPSLKAFAGLLWPGEEGSLRNKRSNSAFRLRSGQHCCASVTRSTLTCKATKMKKEKKSTPLDVSVQIQ